MKIIKNIWGHLFALPINDLDTDRIIPARFLKCVTFDGLGEHVFKDDRAALKGQHPFDLEANKDANFLITGSNFGSGSSREHAVPALTQRGIEVVIALSFAEIFRGNATGNGLVCVTVTEEDHATIMREVDSGITAVSIDLEKMEIAIGQSLTVPCSMPECDQYMFLTGTWDDMATCLTAGDLIEEVARRQPYNTIPALADAA